MLFNISKLETRFGLCTLHEKLIRGHFVESLCNESYQLDKDLILGKAIQMVCLSEQVHLQQTLLRRPPMQLFQLQLTL